MTKIRHHLVEDGAENLGMVNDENVHAHGRMWNGGSHRSSVLVRAVAGTMRASKPNFLAAGV